MTEPGFASLGPTLLARKGGAKPAMRPQLAPLVQDEQELTEVAEDQLEDLGWNDMGHDQGGDSQPEGGADIVPINADVATDHTMHGPGPIVRRQQRRLEERVLADAVMTGPDDAEPEDDDSRYAAQYAAGSDETEDYEGEDYDAEEYETEDYESEDYGAEDDAGEVNYAPLATQPAAAPRKIPAIIAAPEPAPIPAPRHAARTQRMPVAQAARRAAFTLRLDADRHLKLRLAATMQGVSAQALLTEALDAMLAEFDDLDVIANHLKRH